MSYDELRLEEFEEYLIDRERTWNTRDAYIRSVKAFFERYDEITKANLVAYKEYEINSHKPATAALRLVAMNVYCDFIGKPECKVKRVKIYNQDSIENVPTEEEYRYLLDCLLKDGNEKFYWMVRFMASTGARASELVRFEKSCLKTGRVELMTKGKIRRILVPRSLIEESKSYFEKVDSKYLFPNRYGEVMKAQSISKMMTKFGEKYGIRPEILHAHAFRHFFAMRFLETNGNLTLLSNLLGHESIKTTAIYLQMSEDQQQKELDEAMNW